MYEYSYSNMRKLVLTEKGKEFAKKTESTYLENYALNPIPGLSFADYKRYEIDGERRGFEKKYFERRRRLALLQLLAVYDDKYLIELEEIISAICDEFTWVVSAHARFCVDLFSAETGAYLAETAYIFGDKLSAEIQRRIRVSLENKIVNEYEKGKIGWEDFTNNWLSVCAGSIGLVYLYAFPERFDGVKQRITGSMKRFIDGFSDDGYCSEGVGYWEYGFSFFCLYYDLYEQFFDERPNFIDGEKVQNILNFASNARMNESVFIPFADGGYPKTYLNKSLMCAIKRLYGEKFIFPDCGLSSHSISISSKALLLRSLRGLDYESEEKESEKSVYYEDAQVFIRKRKNYSFVVKGGHNAEEHNHNDIGAFQIVKNGKRYICDFGCGYYTKEYFGTAEQRYAIFACNALSHSVPIIDGKLQPYGKEYHAKVLNCDDESVTLDLAKAYDTTLKRLLVKYTAQEKGVTVDYRVSGAKQVVYHFVSDIKPSVTGKTVIIDDMQITTDLLLEPKISVAGDRKSDGNVVNAYIIEYSVSANEETTARFNFEFLE